MRKHARKPDRGHISRRAFVGVRASVPASWPPAVRPRSCSCTSEHQPPPPRRADDPAWERPMIEARCHRRAWPRAVGLTTFKRPERHFGQSPSGTPTDAAARVMRHSWCSDEVPSPDGRNPSKWPRITGRSVPQAASVTSIQMGRSGRVVIVRGELTVPVRDLTAAQGRRRRPVIELGDFVASDGRRQPNPGRRRRG
jgi:hypothetical protein